MAQTIRITITPELENALQILRQSTLGKLKTADLIKMAIGKLAQIKKEQEMSPEELDLVSARLFYSWAKEDGTLDIDNIAHPEQLKPFDPTT